MEREKRPNGTIFVRQVLGYIWLNGHALQAHISTVSALQQSLTRQAPGTMLIRQQMTATGTGSTGQTLWKTDSRSRVDTTSYSRSSPSSPRNIIVSPFSDTYR